MKLNENNISNFGTVCIGTVVSSLDDDQAGILNISPLTPIGSTGMKPIKAAMASPIAGDGYGFACIPGPGAVVLFTNVQHGGTEGIPFQYIWFSCVYQNMPGGTGQVTTGNDVKDSTALDQSEVDHLQRAGGEDKRTYSAQVPEAGNIYKDNNYPEQFVIKSPNQHKVIMSHKITDKGTHDNSVHVQSQRGAYVRIDDGPPGLKMDRITITDELKNREEIITGGLRPEMYLLETKGDHDYISVHGQQHQIIMTGEGDQIRENKGSGDIVDVVHQSNYFLTAEKNINRLSTTGDITEVCKKGDITVITDTGDIKLNAAAHARWDVGDTLTVEAGTSITLRCGASTILMTPASITITAPFTDFA
tara:strand:+ start:586 stop:1671 length:1086 start_codon:yes stop_codon:yes gene_type:complete